MRFIQIAGAARSGKTTVVLNLRRHFGVLYGREHCVYLPEHRLVFLGRGLKAGASARFAGMDVFGPSPWRIEKFVREKVLPRYPDDTTVIMDTYLPVLGGRLFSTHRRIVKFCETSREQYLARELRYPVEHYMERQRRYLLAQRNADVDLEVWSSTQPLQLRVQNVAGLLGIESIADVVTDFESLDAAAESDPGLGSGS